MGVLCLNSAVYAFTPSHQQSYYYFNINELNTPPAYTRARPVIVELFSANFLVVEVYLSIINNIQ